MSEESRTPLLQEMLYPLCRFLLKLRIGFPALVEHLRRALIKAACEEITRRGEKITVSRISVMTALDRRDIKRIHITKSPPVVTAPITARVLSCWEQDPRFVGKQGTPRPLSFVDGNGDFRTLVAEVSKDVGARSVLAELIRLNSVAYDGKQVRFLQAVQYEHVDPSKAFALLSRGFEALGDAVEENVFRRGTPHNLHIHTEYDNVFKADVPRIRQWLLREGAKLHARARQMLTKMDKDLSPDSAREGGARVVLVTASFTEEPLAAMDETVRPTAKARSQAALHGT